MMEYKWFILKAVIIYGMIFLFPVGSGKDIVTVWSMYKFQHIHPLVGN